MVKKISVLALAGLIALPALSMAGGSGGKGSAANVDDLERKIEELSRQLLSVQEHLAQLKAQQEAQEKEAEIEHLRQAAAAEARGRARDLDATIAELLGDKFPVVDNFLDAYGSMRNTLAANMDANVKNHVFFARARKHDGCLEAALHPDAVPPASGPVPVRRSDRVVPGLHHARRSGSCRVREGCRRRSRRQADQGLWRGHQECRLPCSTLYFLLSTFYHLPSCSQLKITYQTFSC